MIVFVSKYLIPKGYSGIAVFPFIVFRDEKEKVNQRVVQHEKIHLRQQLELLLLPFFIWYALEFLYLWFHYFDKNKAYKNISFEREAYANEHDTLYLKYRSFWRFINYIGVATKL